MEDTQSVKEKLNKERKKEERVDGGREEQSKSLRNNYNYLWTDRCDRFMRS